MGILHIIGNLITCPAFVRVMDFGYAENARMFATKLLGS